MNGDIWTTLQQASTTFLDLAAQVVSPDWNALVRLIPLALVPLVLLHLVISGGVWTLFGITKPRPRVRWEMGPRSLERDERGAPIAPLGLPFSLRLGLAYPSGTARSDDGEDLAVICPMCRVERPAQLPTCGSCGLVLTVRQGLTVARPAGPPPGGAAIA
ncbi:MAG TPA: hypothetical protein VLM76_04995 [Patescibacteria group bacterium]|nr:hypothetical protein [Patescibacteria group bacterium]